MIDLGSGAAGQLVDDDALPCSYEGGCDLGEVGVDGDVVGGYSEEEPADY